MPLKISYILPLPQDLMKACYSKYLAVIIGVCIIGSMTAPRAHAWTQAQARCAGQQANMYPGNCYTPYDQYNNYTSVNIPPPVTCINNCSP